MDQSGIKTSISMKKHSYDSPLTASSHPSYSTNNSSSSSNNIGYSTSHRNIYLATLAAQLFIMAMGLVSSFASPALVDIVKPGSRFTYLTTDQITWIASLPNLSGVVGNILSGYCSHRFGRKCVLMSISVSFTLSWLLIAYAQTVEFIYAGRLLSGFCAGMSTVAVPAYVVEISTVKIRGLLTAGFQVAFSSGVLVMTACGIVLRWSWLAILGAVVVTSGSCLLYFMPESPPWLIKNNRSEEAMKGIKFLKGKNHNAEEEFDEIEAVLVLEPIGGFNFRELLTPGLFKPLLITFGLMFYQSFSGAPAIMSYTVKIFKEQRHFMDPNVASTVVALVQVLSTIASSLLMDRAGRKFLYITSGISMTVSLIILGIHSYLTQKCDVVNVPYWSWIPLICFMVYISSYALGFGPIPYVVIPELVPTHTRSFVMAVGCASASFLGFLVIKSFIVIRTAIGFYGLYWSYSAVTLCGFLTYWIFIPETKGRSIQEINQLFSRS